MNPIHFKIDSALSPPIRPCDDHQYYQQPHVSSPCPELTHHSYYSTTALRHRRRNNLHSGWRFNPLFTATAAILLATVSFVKAFTSSSSSHVVVTSQQSQRRRQQQSALELRLVPPVCDSRLSLSTTTSCNRHRRRCRPFLRWSPLYLSDNPNDDGDGGGAASAGSASASSGAAAAFSDEEEWRAILAAFRMYKAAYGDLKVPSRFVVPSLPPWPENAWGLKLGHRVAAIRATGRFVKDQPERLRALEKLGFQWQLRSGGASSTSDGLDGVTLDQIYTALATYRQFQSQTSTAGNPLSVPPTFIVPNSPQWPESTRGLPLGKLLPLVRSKAFLKANPEAKERLEALDVELDGKTAMNDARFQKVYEALKRYREIHGDLLVPQPFVVPSKSNDWAEDLWGLRLGARVNAIRSQGTFVGNNPDRKKLLDDLGFVWSPPPSTDRGKKRGRRSKAELENERMEFGNRQAAGDDDDLDFNSMDGEEEEEEVDDDDQEDDREDENASSSLETWFGQSFDFGSSNNLSGGSPPQAPPTWGLQQGGAPKLAGDMSSNDDSNKVVDEFLEPQSLADSLKAAFDRAVEVGVIEPISEGKRVKKGKREKDIPWFNDDFGDEFVFEDVVEALTIYKSMYGDFSNLTQGDFVVPAGGGGNDVFGDFDGEEFDVEASSRAAAAIAAYRKKNQLAESEELVESEIRRLQGDAASSSRERNSAALQLQSSTATEWPEHLAGMSLGNIVTRIRDGSLEVKHLPERKALLDAIDFDWGDPMQFIDIPFEKAMCAMYAYYLVRGDLFVYEEFVIPDEDPWPKVLAGYEIGKAVKRLREQQYFLEAYHPEKVSLLRMIDFMWFPTAALPLDPNEPEMTPEMLLLSAMGHPDYAKMIDIPMGLPDKIIADGPFFESDDPRYWWRKWHNWEYVKDYWYQQGRRDNAFVLRGMGYPQMAEEHEAIYGPGLFTQLDQVMKLLEDGIEGRTQEEKEEILAKLNEIRQEMVGCTDIHPQDRATLIDDLDAQIHALVTEGKSDANKISRFQAEAYLYEESNGNDANDANGRYEEEEASKTVASREEDSDGGEDDDDDFDDADDVDVEEELGLFQ